MIHDTDFLRATLSDDPEADLQPGDGRHRRRPFVRAEFPVQRRILMGVYAVFALFVAVLVVSVLIGHPPLILAPLAY